MESGSSNASAYPFEEFRRHYEEINSAANLFKKIESDPDDSQDFIRSVDVVMHMRRQCATEQESFLKGSRFLMMMNYLARNSSDFDRGDYAVFGSERVGGLVSQHLLKAVHHFFTEPDRVLNGPPAPNEVIELADRLRKV